MEKAAKPPEKSALSLVCLAPQDEDQISTGKSKHYLNEAVLAHVTRDKYIIRQRPHSAATNRTTPGVNSCHLFLTGSGLSSSVIPSGGFPQKVGRLWQRRSRPPGGKQQIEVP
jgi:hypothetical protein